MSVAQPKASKSKKGSTSKKVKEQAVTDALIDSHVSAAQAKLAIDALLTHSRKHQEKQEETQLLAGTEPFVWLVVAVKKIHAERKLKPYKIPLSHPLIDPRNEPICLITKDPQREYKDLLESHNIKFISRVVDIQKLKGKWKPYEARRMLLKENGLFLADERVVPLLPKLLGKVFFAAKKQPIPVSLTRKNLKAELESAVSSTYFHQNQGTCSSIKLGRVSSDPKHLFANLETSLPSIMSAIPDGWSNIQSLHIKTNSSVSLPIWTCDLDARWEGLTKVPEEIPMEVDEDNKAEEESAEEVTEKKTKKRTAHVEKDEGNPVKKKKVSVDTSKDTPPTPDEPSKKKKSASHSGDSTTNPSKKTDKKSVSSEKLPGSPQKEPSPRTEKKPRPTAADFLQVESAPEKPAPSKPEKAAPTKKVSFDLEKRKKSKSGRTTKDTLLGKKAARL